MFWRGSVLHTCMNYSSPHENVQLLYINFYFLMYVPKFASIVFCHWNKNYNSGQLLPSKFHTFSCYSNFQWFSPFLSLHLNIYLTICIKWVKNIFIFNKVPYIDSYIMFYNGGAYDPINKWISMRSFYDNEFGFHKVVKVLTVKRLIGTWLQNN